MNRKQRQEKKKKDREKKSKAKVMKRRGWIRKKAREIKEEEKWQKHFQVKQMPIRNKPQEIPTEPAVTSQRKIEDARRDQWIKKRLEHNMKILEALEEEAKREEAARAEFNEKLEATGAKTMREKFDTMGQFTEDIVEVEEKRDEHILPMDTECD